MKNIGKRTMVLLLALWLLTVSMMGVLPVAADGADTDLLVYEIVDGAAVITGCDTSIEGLLVFPEDIEGCPITTIGEKAFVDCVELTYVVIPETVTTIGKSAFYSCKNLIEVEIPASVTSIGDDVFGNCTSLTSIPVVEDNPAYCDKDGVLYTKDQTQLLRMPSRHGTASYVIPDSVTTISSRAFFG